jgi:hypothetical protein
MHCATPAVSLTRYAEIAAQFYKEDPANVFDAYGNSIFGSYLNDNLGTSS